MKIAITGATGFIGKKVCAILKSDSSNQVISLTRTFSNEPDTYTTDYSLDSLYKIFANTDLVIHLASKRGTTGSISQYHENEIITENILIAMAKANVKHIIFASTIAVYSDKTKIPWSEKELPTPKTTYAVSKLACENLCQLYSKQNNFTYTILRIAQVLGIEEQRPGMMNTFIEKAYKKQTLTVMGESIAKREYVFVDDVVKAIKILSEKYSSQIFNLGSGKAYTNLEIAKTINEVFENQDNLLYEEEKEENIESSLMDISKIKNDLNFEPLELYEALKIIKMQKENKEE